MLADSVGLTNFSMLDVAAQRPLGIITVAKAISTAA